MSASPSRPDVYYGGQAVIEGVMIRAPRHMAVAVRGPGGAIVRHSEELTGFTTGPLRRIPLVRGAIVLWETLSLGMRAINYSSRIAYEAAAEEAKAEIVEEYSAREAALIEQRVDEKLATMGPLTETQREVVEEVTAGAKAEARREFQEAAEEESPELTDAAMWGSMAIGIVLAVAIFFIGPVLLANFLESQGIARAGVVGIEAALRLVLFVAYIALIGLMPDIRRVFQYHGAEHMTIHAYEGARPLTVPDIRGFPKEHTRCGTSFLVVVIVIALAAFLAFDLLVDEGIFVRIASRVVLLPPIAGISYEILRLGARFESNPLMRALFAPNIALQALTTRVPEDDQIEVAIAAFETAVEASAEE